jgi:hypothetical protein
LGVTDLVSPLQIVAADVDQSGMVSILDAWHILRYVVGLGSEHIGKVSLVSDTLDLTAVDVSNSALDSLDVISLLEDGSDDLTLLVYGDVDGSATADGNASSTQGVDSVEGDPIQGLPVDTEPGTLPPISGSVEPQSAGWLELSGGVINV